MRYRLWHAPCLMMRSLVDQWGFEPHSPDQENWDMSYHKNWCDLILSEGFCPIGTLNPISITGVI